MTVNPVKKLTRFELSDVEVVFPNDATAVLTYRVKQGDWKCVMHTETPAGEKPRTN